MHCVTNLFDIQYQEKTCECRKNSVTNSKYSYDSQIYNFNMELSPQPVKHFLNNGTISEQNAYFLAMMDPNFCHAQSFTEQVGILC